MVTLTLCKMKEQDIQKKISDKHNQSGWFVVKLIKTNVNGVTDLVACKAARCIWIEVKKQGGKLSKLQEFTIKQMRAKGLNVIVAFGVEDIKELL